MSYGTGIFGWLDRRGGGSVQGFWGECRGSAPIETAVAVSVSVGWRSRPSPLGRRHDPVRRRGSDLGARCRVFPSWKPGLEGRAACRSGGLRHDRGRGGDRRRGLRATRSGGHAHQPLCHRGHLPPARTVFAGFRADTVGPGFCNDDRGRVWDGSPHKGGGSVRPGREVVTGAELRPPRVFS